MSKATFFINNALSVNRLSVFSNEERFYQTVDTIKSIDNHIPGADKFIFDSSPTDPDQNYLKALSDMGVQVFYTGNIPVVREFSNKGQRSLAECISFMAFLEWYKKHFTVEGRIYKLSGRYQLSMDFNSAWPGCEDAFVFASALDSWLPEETQKVAGVDKLYRLRLWHMDSSLLSNFQEELPNIYHDCLSYGIDVEHSYYKNLSKYKVVEVPKIGVIGNIAPSGEYIDE